MYVDDACMEDLKWHGGLGEVQASVYERPTTRLEFYLIIPSGNVWHQAVCVGLSRDSSQENTPSPSSYHRHPWTVISPCSCMSVSVRAHVYVRVSALPTSFCL